MGYSFRLAARVLLSHRQDNTYHSLCYTSCGALVGTRNGARPMLIISHLHGELYQQVIIDKVNTDTCNVLLKSVDHWLERTHGGSIELFLISVQNWCNKMWYVLSCIRNMHIKRSFVINTIIGKSRSRCSSI